MLENLINRKINTKNGNPDQLNLIINLKLGYNKNVNLIKKQNT